MKPLTLRPLPTEGTVLERSQEIQHQIGSLVMGIQCHQRIRRMQRAGRKYLVGIAGGG